MAPGQWGLRVGWHIFAESRGPPDWNWLGRGCCNGSSIKSFWHACKQDIRSIRSILRFGPWVPCSTRLHLHLQEVQVTLKLFWHFVSLCWSYRDAPALVCLSGSDYTINEEFNTSPAALLLIFEVRSRPWHDQLARCSESLWHYFVLENGVITVCSCQSHPWNHWYHIFSCFSTCAIWPIEI